jgi:DNA polymerase-3 subunit delta'
MPFAPDVFLSHLDLTLDQNRLAHGYLLTGASADVLETTAIRMADKLLGEPSRQHPDAHWVRPQSKTRRYATEQIRELEGKLYLKPYQADRKVAVLEHAERMCLGRAEPANAFLKTLEEPPARTILILWTCQPQALLATIVSRCVRVDLQGGEGKELSDDLQDFLQKWSRVESGSPEIRAYRRASLLSQYWAQRRKALSGMAEIDETEDREEENLAAMEGEFALERQGTIAALEKWHWEQMSLNLSASREDTSSHLRAIQALERLNESLQRNVDVQLAVELACLKMEKCVNL